MVSVRRHGHNAIERTPALTGYRDGHSALSPNFHERLGASAETGANRTNGWMAAGMTTEPGQRILLVDDEPAVREAIRAGLEFEGFRVTMAADGHQAMAEIAKEQPDVVLLDVM